MSGSGNDFVFVDGRQSPAAEWPPERIRRVCDRNNGVGSDGLVVLEPGPKPDHLNFTYFNADGSRGELCGNASLCSAVFAARFGLASDRMVLQTDVGPVSAEILDEKDELARIGLPDIETPGQAPIERLENESEAWFLTVGVPHVILKMAGQNPETSDVEGRGRVLRYDPSLGQAGANINFLTQLPSGKWRMRTYERGVEAETLACGTGATASAAALAAAGIVELPWTVTTSSGEDLTISGDLDRASGEVKDVKLTGHGRYLFEAHLAF
ncbi:MAG: diaminopimelate epimerase [Gemmatimonadota bacterium]|nr:diaminopimelate epimerase [Gemmatimonadota bacterium]